MDRLPPAASRHAEHCPACARFGNELVALRTLLREPGRVPAPPDFDIRLAARMREHRRSSRPAPAWAWLHRRPLAAAASFVIVLSGTVAVTQLTPAPAPQSTATTSPATSPPVEPITAAPAPSANDGGQSPLPRRVLGMPRSAPHSATVRTVSHRIQRPPAREDAMIFVRDTVGARVVSVPDVLVGAQEIVAPVSAQLVDTGGARTRASF